ncbi:hypothetical protein Rsub_06910 [Raphidocelis subcapitata]|uniref:Uncharacterized protein n=1 Tax=Raphidocelis subcapitata TaxID=307507 RepID=A0A2V0P345_9CHLO|nr:hypothetical protein Rsub_06910 [Raphidocelis subcapitata]|eukprot:GBF94288.1 hypothetical protein Rsub_06910 [Raphidocelis subcapitata]
MAPFLWPDSGGAPSRLRGGIAERILRARAAALAQAGLAPRTTADAGGGAAAEVTGPQAGDIMSKVWHRLRQEEEQQAAAGQQAQQAQEGLGARPKLRDLLRDDPLFSWVAEQPRVTVGLSPQRLIEAAAAGLRSAVAAAWPTGSLLHAAAAAIVDHQERKLEGAAPTDPAEGGRWLCIRVDSAAELLSGVPGSNLVPVLPSMHPAFRIEGGSGCRVLLLVVDELLAAAAAAAGQAGGAPPEALAQKQAQKQAQQQAQQQQADLAPAALPPPRAQQPSPAPPAPAAAQRAPAAPQLTGRPLLLCRLGLLCELVWPSGIGRETQYKSLLAQALLRASPPPGPPPPYGAACRFSAATPGDAAAEGWRQLWGGEPLGLAALLGSDSVLRIERSGAGGELQLVLSIRDLLAAAAGAVCAAADAEWPASAAAAPGARAARVVAKRVVAEHCGKVAGREKELPDQEGMDFSMYKSKAGIHLALKLPGAPRLADGSRAAQQLFCPQDLLCPAWFVTTPPSALVACHAARSRAAGRAAGWACVHLDGLLPASGAISSSGS